MMTGAVSQRAGELAAEGTAFVVATVVRAQRPTSVKAGEVALVLGDGTIEGFVGGVCAQQSVRVYSLKAIEIEEALLLRIVPDGPVGEDPETGREVPIEEGAVTAQNPCLSGGAIEIFLEPVLPTPRVLVVGDTPIAAAVLSLGAELGLDLVPVDEGAAEPSPGDLALVVAAHGRDELHTLRRGLEAGVPYIGLVASRQAWRGRDRRAARRRGFRRAPRADRRARRDRHRRPHPSRDRTVDPRDDRRRAPRRTRRGTRPRRVSPLRRALPAPPRRRSRSTRSVA